MIYCENVVKYCGRSIFFFNSSSNFNNYYFFSSYFRQWHCHNCHQFFFPISAMALPQLVFSQQVWAAGISVMWLQKFKIFSLPLFLSLSYFCWFSAIPLPKFNLFPQFSKQFGTVPVTQINSGFSNIQPRPSLVTRPWRPRSSGLVWVAHRSYSPSSSQPLAKPSLRSHSWPLQPHGS